MLIFLCFSIIYIDSIREDNKMSYLYMNFTNRMNTKNKYLLENFNSLREQFEPLQRKLRNYNKTVSSLEDLINKCLPQMPNTYYVSMPGFERELDESNPNRDFLRNVVIRPERSIAISSCIPENFHIIFIGDIVFNNTVISFDVKGIELMDVNIAKFGEYEIQCTAACAITRDDKNRPNYGVRDLRDSVLTYDLVDELCKEMYSVPNPDNAIRTFDAWGKYLRFRNYYIEHQEGKFFECDDVKMNKAYFVKRTDYLENEDEYKNYLLDGISDLTTKQGAILSKNVENSEQMNLLSLVFKGLKKDILADMVTRKNGQKTSKLLNELYTFTRNPMGLSPEVKRKEGGRVELRNVIPIGEKYNGRIYSKEIEPDCSGVEKTFKNRLEKEKKELDSRYNELLKQDLDNFAIKLEEDSKVKFDEIMTKYSDELDANIADELSKRSDKDIEKKIKKQVLAIKTKIESKFKKEMDGFKKSISEKKKQIKKSNGLSEEDIEVLKNDIKELEEKMTKIKGLQEKEIANEVQNIDVADMYYSKKEKFLEKKRGSENFRLTQQKKVDLKNQEDILRTNYKEEKKKELAIIERELNKEKENAIKQKKEDETYLCYYVYFNIEQPEEANRIEEKIKASGNLKMVRDSRAESAKVRRQETALEALKKGYVRNPFLAAYLFNPESLPNTAPKDTSNIEWNLDSLNDKQKEAVCKAMASDSIFLLQGPPGTGKTQVIAELSAQLAKNGKKILISSETHKAIDNVFERLPKIPEIRPVRLIPSHINKETEYSISSLLPNFYGNIVAKIGKQIKRYDDFNGLKDEFEESRKELVSLNSSILRLEKNYNAIKSEREKLKSEEQCLSNKISDLDDIINDFNHKLSILNTVTKRFKNLRLEEFEEDYLGVISDTASKVEAILAKYDIFSISLKQLSLLYNFDFDIIDKEMQMLFGENPELRDKKKRLAELKREMDGLCDEYGDIIEGKGVEYKRCQEEFARLKKEAKQLESGNDTTSLSIRDLEIGKIISEEVLRNNINKEFIASIKDNILDFKKDVDTIVGDVNDLVENNIRQVESEKYRINNEKIDLKLKKNLIDERLSELADDNSYSEYVRQSRRLVEKISLFFNQFNITREYNPENKEEAIAIIDEEWSELESNFKKSKVENNTKIPMYKRISNYLSNEIEDDEKITYTKDLYDNANIFGMTCTANNYFNSNTLDDLSAYGINDIDIKFLGIDVVIVDEVSKSSFLDLLIPILYGKTVILVGDHRQLPPMYDLKHLKEENFEDLDDTIVDYKKNKEFTILYEECFFKSLFERIPSAYKIMLDKQYRCHSQIMNVFNCFYGGEKDGLQIGFANQDLQKQHNLYVNIKNKSIITPDKHVYFIDCTKHEDQLDGSTSIINREEADVVYELLKKIDASAQSRDDKFAKENKGKKPNKLSLGIICTYGDQAGIIKKKLRDNHFKSQNLMTRGEDRLIISTVDDFQGDERDIIIVSMVRNPEEKNSRAEFIKQFERINVAFSRARSLLIIVGSKRFLTSKSIDLPDINGNKEKDKMNYFVYRDIINSIEVDGNGYINASDILGGE